MYDVAIIGLGYVGLPLCLQFSRNNCRVLGLDIDIHKVEALMSGKSYIHHISAEAVAEQIDSERLVASVDFSLIRDCAAVVICVPTPLNKIANRIFPTFSRRAKRWRRTLRRERWSSWNRRLIQGRPMKTCEPFWRQDQDWSLGKISTWRFRLSGKIQAIQTAR